MNYTKAKIYFPSGAIKYAVGTTYNKTKTCSKITVDYNVVPPTISIWYTVVSDTNSIWRNDNQEKEEFFNLPFSVELAKQEEN